MPKPLNQTEITKAAETLAKELGSSSDAKKTELDFLQTIPAINRTTVLTKARQIFNTPTTNPQPTNVSTQTATAPETTTEPSVAEATKAANEATTEATTEAGKRGENQKLDPANNAAHKVLFGLKQIQGLAKLDGYSSFNFPKMREDKADKYKDKTDEELAKVIVGQFELFGRKFLVYKDEKPEDKPLANPEFATHAKASELIKSYVLAAQADTANQVDGKPAPGKVNQAIAKQASEIFSKVKELYQGENKKTGKAAVTSFDTVDWGLF